MMWHQRSLPVLSLLFITLAACGGGDDAATPDPKAFCDHLRVVSDGDRRTDQLVQQGAGWDVVQLEMKNQTATTGTAYTSAERVAPSHLRGPVKVLGDFTAKAGDAIARANGFAEAQALLTADKDEVLEVGRASQAVDEYTRAKCGFSIHNEEPAGR